MTRARGVVIACAALALSAGVLLATRTPPRLFSDTPERHEIRMRGNSFAPRARNVVLGDTIVWINADIVRHNAVRRDLFDTGELKSGEQFAWVPTDTGTVRYQCTIHQRMRGLIRVDAGR